MGPIYTLNDFLDMVRRRLHVIVAITLLGCLVSVFYALSLTHLYRSSEVIQIEQPQVDSELAQTTVAGSAARRLQLIEQRLMARDTVLEIIDKFDLYADVPGLAPSEKVFRLRSAVSITGQAAAREGFGDDGAISILTITAEMDTPEKARAVAHEFADRTRAMSAARRIQQAEATLQFFTKREEALRTELNTVEDSLAEFRRENDLSVSGSMEFRREELASLNAAILELDRDIIAAELARDRVDPDQRAETIARQREELAAQIDSLDTQRSLLQSRRDGLTAALQTSPDVARRQAEIERRASQLQSQLDQITMRRNEAELGVSLETNSNSERMITIEEASLPDYPITSSRRRTAMMGGVASAALGLLVAFLLELRHPVLRTARQMERETGLRPVVSIPDTRGERQRRDVAGLAKRWHARRSSGLRGRAARLARSAGLGRKA